VGAMAVLLALVGLAIIAGPALPRAWRGALALARSRRPRARPAATVSATAPRGGAPDLLRRDLIYSKACGFNMVRFIAGMAHPWQLDLCDEIGLMVYEENMAAWGLQDSPEMGERFDRSVLDMVLRDRNHPAVTIWGLLNETPDGPVFRQAVASLGVVRELDDTRLVLLGSGRWDNQFQIGSASNPGSSEWEAVTCWIFRTAPSRSSCSIARVETSMNRNTKARAVPKQTDCAHFGRMSRIM